MATYADMEELIRMGAYRAGSSAEVDRAIKLHRPLEEFLAQGKEEATTLGQGYQRLEQIVRAVETEKLTVCDADVRPRIEPPRAVRSPRDAASIGRPGLRGSCSR